MGGQTTRQIQRQIKGTQNVKQITHAMELVSAAKLKRVEKKLDSIRPYWKKMRNIFGHLLEVLEDEEYEVPHFQQNDEVDQIGIIVIAGEKGLCGGYNADIFERAERFISSLPDEAEKKFIAIGKKTKKWLRNKPYETVHTRLNLPTEPSFELGKSIANVAERRFLDGTFDEVHIVYTHFMNALKQQPKTFQFLPVKPEAMRESQESEEEQETTNQISEYIFEPAPDELLEQFLPRFVNMLFYTLLLESLTSEHGARMVAMRDATDNAEDKIDELTHTYNQARQESITRELLDIVGAVSAQEDNE